MGLLRGQTPDLSVGVEYTHVYVRGLTPFRRHFFGSRFLYMPSMRWVTRKPPKMFTDAITSARKPKILASKLPAAISATPTASSAPTTITEEMALVTDMSGVCRAGVTLHTTK